MGTLRDLKVFQKAQQLAMDIFWKSAHFPDTEKFALITQIRKSSRSVCANLAEAYRRRHYKPHFLSKITDCQAENNETEIWIEFSKNCRYISEETYEDWLSRNTEVGKILHYMYHNPEKFM